MTAHDFDILAAKVLAGEATGEEQARLQAALAEDLKLRQEFADLQAAWSVLQEHGPLSEALQAAPARPPGKRLREWRAAVAAGGKTKPARSAKFILWPRFVGYTAACFLLLALLSVIFFLQPDKSVRVEGPVGYAIPSQPTIELSRGRQTIRMETVTTLRSGDEIRLSAGASATVLTATGLVTWRGPGTFPAPPLVPVDTSSDSNHLSGWSRRALFEIPSVSLLAVTRSGGSFPIYSPSGFTTHTTPLLLWSHSPGRFYNVSIRDDLSPASPPWRATNVISPLPFTAAWPGRELSAGGLYRLTIRATDGSTAPSEITFRIFPATAAGTPELATPMLRAYQLMHVDPPCYGDALALLLMLPPAEAPSELALRLKLQAFGRLGYHDDFQAVLQQLQSRP